MSQPQLNDDCLRVRLLHRDYIAAHQKRREFQRGLMASTSETESAVEEEYRSAAVALVEAMIQIIYVD